VSNTAHLVIAILLAVAAYVARADEVKFENDLAACATISVNKVSTESNVVLATTTVKLAKPIGDCRCLSALATYSSSVDRGGVRHVLQEGLVSLKAGGEKTFVLATEPALVAGKTVTVNLGCADPL
jgi:hypothetical protein